MDNKIHQLMKNQLAEFVEVHDKLVNNGFGNNVRFADDKIEEAHKERCNCVLLDLEELICEHVEQLKAEKGQVS